MQNFIVLGLVPGTGLQITFIGWIISSLIVLDALCVIFFIRKHLVRNWLVVLSIIWVISGSRNRLIELFEPNFVVL
jgi:hypothetical protein